MMTNNENTKAVKPIEIHNEEPLEQVAGGKRSVLMSNDVPFVRDYDCIGCCECVYVCPTESISVFNGYAHIDTDRCTRCGACTRVCVSDAICI